MPRNRRRSSRGYWRLFASSNTRSLKASHEASRLKNRFGDWAVADISPVSNRLLGVLGLCADIMIHHGDIGP